MPDKTPLGGKIGRANHQQEFSYFLLEHNDQSNETNVHKTTHHATDHFHLNQLSQLPQSPNNHYSNKNIDGNRTFDQFINVVE